MIFSWKHPFFWGKLDRAIANHGQPAAGDTPFCWGKPDFKRLDKLNACAGDTPFCWGKLIPPLDLFG